MFTRKDTYTIPDGLREYTERRFPSLGYRNLLEADPESYISPVCQIYGKVKLGYHASVMAGAQLRGDTDYIEIGAESNVQENCVIHVSEGNPTIVGEHSTVGHGAILHGCRIGDNALVGMGAIVLDGVVVEDNALVAAGALVTKGTVVPSGYMAIGMPARIKGPMSEEQLTNNVTSFAEANVVESLNMFNEGLLEHPSEELFRKIGSIR